MPKWQLKRTRQCQKCPWKTDTDPQQIPNGYSTQLHHQLKDTIAESGQIRGYLQAMACHESPVEKEGFCIGWLHHQLTTGNNIDLRLRCRSCSCSNINDIQLDGEQHQRFENTIPSE